MTRKSSVVRLVLLAAIAALGVALAPTALVGKRGSNTAGAGCSISPSQVTSISYLPRWWAVDSPNHGGFQRTFTTTGNGNTSALWGFIAPEQKGQLHLPARGQGEWPAGTFTQSYATCSGAGQPGDATRSEIAFQEDVKGAG